MNFFKASSQKLKGDHTSSFSGAIPSSPGNPELNLTLKYDEDFLRSHLTPFFNSLSQYKFQEAQSHVKKTNIFAQQRGLYWDPIGHALLLLIVAEGLYHSLTHLELNRPRNDVKNLYANVGSQFREALAAATQLPTYDGSLLNEISADISTLAQKRLALVTYYRWLSDLSPPFKYSELAETTAVVSRRQLDCLNNPLLAGVQLNMKYESTVILKLFMTQIAISEFNFKDSILLNFQAQAELKSWRQHSIPASELQSSSQHTMPMLYSWLCFFNRHLNSSISLYFHRVLKKMEEESGGDFRQIISHLDYDYCQMIETFATRTDAYCFCVILESEGCNYHEFGYQVPQEDGEKEHLSGLRLWPAIFTYPSDAQIWKHWANIISILMDSKTSQTLPSKQIHHHHEQKRGDTYFISKVDSLVYLAAIYQEKKKENDKAVNDFMKFLSDMLRNVKLFQKLRPNHRV